MVAKYEMRYQIISEGPTLVHAVDLAGREALQKSLDDLMKSIWATFNINGYDEDDPDAQHRDYDRFYQHFFDQENAQGLVERVCAAASKALSTVIQNDLRSRFGSVMKWSYNEGQDIHDIPVEKMRVIVTVQPTDGQHTDAAGYFMPAIDASYIKVHCEADDLLRSAMSAVSSMAFGDGEHRDDLVNAIAPTFAHEYSHLLQYFAAQSYQAFHSGITSLGGKNAPRQGDRTETGWWRYIGSNAEIDSWGTSVASQIIADQRRGRYSSELDNDQVNYALRSAQEGYTSSSSYETYMRYYQDALAGHYDEIGLSRGEAIEVWRRFLKAVHAKLSAYKKERHGRDTSGWHTGRAPKEWLIWAKEGLPRFAARVADQIAREVADQAYIPYGEKQMRFDSTTFDRATSFIDSYFLGNEYDWEKSKKVNDSLKRLVSGRIPQYQRSAA